MVVPSKQAIGWIKAVLFVLGLTPLLRLVWLGVSDALGANPVEFIERSTGTWALVMLLVTLSFTPVRLITGLAWPIQLRRMAGLFMFFYAVLHITTYIWLDYWFVWSDISKDIVKHPYVLVGFSAFLFTIPLALTSNNYMMRKLRDKWKTLHKLSYIIAVLGVVHFWWLVKKDIREPLIYAFVLIALLVIRMMFNKKARKYGKTL